MTGISRISSGGAAQGRVLWFGVMTAAAMAVLALLSDLPRRA